MGQRGERVSPGQPWKPERAHERNAWTDAAKRIMGMGGQNQTTPTRRKIVDPTVVKVRNNSGGAREQFDVLMLDWTNLLEDDDTTVRLEADVDLQSHGVLAVLLAPVQDAKIAEAAVDGLTWARVNLQTEADDRAYPVDGGHVLKGGFFGPAAIVWKPTPTGYPSEEICLVLLNAPCQPRYFVTPAGGIPAATKTGSGSTTTVEPGSVDDCFLMELDEVNGKWIVSIDGDDAPIEATVYNFAPTAVNGDSPVRAHAGPDWLPVVDLEFCEG